MCVYFLKAEDATKHSFPPLNFVVFIISTTFMLFVTFGFEVWLCPYGFPI